MKKSKIIMMATFLLILVGISVMSVLLPDREFSETENRTLAAKPEIRLDNILNGSFQNDLEIYLNDQICFRENWISLKTSMQKFLGNKDIGGVYLGEDGYLFEKITEEDLDSKLLRKNTRYVKDYFKYCEDFIDPSRLSFMLVPTASLILEDKLPKYAPLFDQETYINKVKGQMDDYVFVDIREELLSKKEQGVYYRTDHHWTTRGAFIAYQQWCQFTGHDIPKEEDYEIQVVSDEFQGSLHSKILDSASAFDEILQYEKKVGINPYTVSWGDESADSLYHFDKLKEKDKYQFFFGGNYDEVVISQKMDTPKGRNLLLIKDSYANAFAPFVMEDYDHVYMVDLRYARMDMRAYIEEHEITDVLVLYNISNFATDRNLYKLRER